MFANLDCMHYRWKICPITWQGQFQDKNDNRLIILEVVTNQSLWIWHVFFNLPNNNNDINVLNRSPLITNLLQGPAQDMDFVVNGNPYPKYYLLTC
jgi:hypothetical protein